MKYFIYCRKSSEEETKQVQSLETQEKMLVEYAKTHNLSIVEVIKESKSAKTDGNRPLFSGMLKRIMDREATGILVLHTDRLTRNGIEAGQIIKLFESSLLQAIRTPTRTYSSVTDILYMDFDFVFASHYSRNLSIRVKEGNMTKRAKGEYVGRPPLGYTWDKGKLVPDPIRSAHIANCFFLYSTGSYSLKQIREMLYMDGLRSRIVGNKVPKSSIHTLLQNPVYYGVINNQGTLQKGIHTPLTTKSIFDKVQLVLQGKNRSKKQKHDFLYRDYLSCGNCQCKLTASVKKEIYNYYYCTNGKGICQEHKDYMNEQYIFNLVLKEFKQITLDKKKADLAFDLYIEDFKQNYQSKGNNREIIQKQIDAIEKKLDRLLDLRLEGAIDVEKFTEKQKKLKSEKTDLEIALSEIKEENLDTTLELLLNFKNRACSLAEMFEYGDDLVRADLLKSALWNLQIKEKKRASIQYKLPYEYLKNVSKTDDLETMLPDLDSNQDKRIQSPLSYH